MKILFVVGQFPVTSETFILNQITSLIDLGHNVYILSLTRPEDTQIAHPDVVKYGLLDKVFYVDIPEDKIQRIRKFLVETVKNIPNISYITKAFFYKFSGLYWAFNNVFKIIPFLKIQPDVVHCHFGVYAREVVFAKTVLPETKFFVTFHGFDIRKGQKEGPKFYSDVFKLFDGVFAICNWNKQQLLELGCPEEKIIDLHNGIDVRFYSPMDGENKEAENEHIILTVARLEEPKNLEFAVEVIARLKTATDVKFKYFIIGEGSLRKAVEDKIATLGLNDTVFLLGAKNREEVVSYMRKARIFFLPSKDEAFPTVLLEAQSCGLPVIATDVAGVKETFLDGKTGFLVKLNDKQSMVEKLKLLLEDESLRKQMGLNARQFAVENFDIKVLAERLVESYNL